MLVPPLCPAIIRRGGITPGASICRSVVFVRLGKPVVLVSSQVDRDTFAVPEGARDKCHRLGEPLIRLRAAQPEKPCACLPEALATQTRDSPSIRAAQPEKPCACLPEALATQTRDSPSAPSRRYMANPCDVIWNRLQEVATDGNA